MEAADNALDGRAGEMDAREGEIEVFASPVAGMQGNGGAADQNEFADIGIVFEGQENAAGIFRQPVDTHRRCPVPRWRSCAPPRRGRPAVSRP